MTPFIQVTILFYAFIFCPLPTYAVDKYGLFPEQPETIKSLVEDYVAGNDFYPNTPSVQYLPLSLIDYYFSGDPVVRNNEITIEGKRVTVFNLSHSKLQDYYKSNEVEGKRMVIWAFGQIIPKFLKDYRIKTLTSTPKKNGDTIYNILEKIWVQGIQETGTNPILKILEDAHKASSETIPLPPTVNEAYFSTLNITDALTELILEDYPAQEPNLIHSYIAALSAMASTGNTLKRPARASLYTLMQNHDTPHLELNRWKKIPTYRVQVAAAQALGQLAFQENPQTYGKACAMLLSHTL